MYSVHIEELARHLKIHNHPTCKHRSNKPFLIQSSFNRPADNSSCHSSSASHSSIHPSVAYHQLHQSSTEAISHETSPAVDSTVYTGQDAAYSTLSNPNIRLRNEENYSENECPNLIKSSKFLGTWPRHDNKVIVLSF